MKKQKQLAWIEEGYRMVAESGFNSLQIESIARKIQKNKSSFYHYFGDMEGFEEELLAHHLVLAEEFAQKASRCENIRPDMVNLFLEHQTDLFFHKQLRIQRTNPQCKACFEKAYAQFETAILDSWAEFLGLQAQPHFARAFLRLISENFLLQITQLSYSSNWLNEYLQEVSALIRDLHSAPNT